MNPELAIFAPHPLYACHMGHCFSVSMYTFIQELFYILFHIFFMLFFFFTISFSSVFINASLYTLFIAYFFFVERLFSYDLLLACSANDRLFVVFFCRHFLFVYIRSSFVFFCSFDLKRLGIGNVKVLERKVFGG